MDLGSTFETSINDLAELIARLSGFQGRVLRDVSKPNGRPRRKPDTSRAKALFGFEAQKLFQEGLLRSIGDYESSIILMLDFAP